MATMKDIAKLAKVSTSTVSHVINKTRFVSEDIATRVTQAAKSLNYHAPSVLARSLKTNRTNTIGLVMSNATNPFFSEVVKGVERSCYQAGYNLILCHTEGSLARVQHSIDTLIQRKVDGLILLCAEEIDEANFDTLERLNELPLVMMDWSFNALNCDKIQDNSRVGGYLAAQFLIDKGHTQIGFISGPHSKYQTQMRFEGFSDAMQKANLPIEQKWLYEGDFECESGYQALITLAKQGELPSAFFVANDMMAMGMINAAHELGIKIPEQLSLIGYDDILIAKYMTPALTTVHQPKFRLGKAAVDALINRINNANTKASLVALTPRVVERQSVASRIKQSVG
jgi:LacI family transcriptional regulator